jgi:hypothetical protein
LGNREPFLVASDEWRMTVRGGVWWW